MDETTGMAGIGLIAMRSSTASWLVFLRFICPRMRDGRPADLMVAPFRSRDSGVELTAGQRFRHDPMTNRSTNFGFVGCWSARSQHEVIIETDRTKIVSAT